MLDTGCWMLDAGCWMLDFLRAKPLEKLYDYMSYRNLEIWKLAKTLVADIHKMSLTKLPKFEMYEEGSQIRRSMKSIRSNIVEGYGRRRYKQEFIHFLTYSQASCDETIDHLEMLFETGSLKDEPLFKNLFERLNELGRKINLFTQSVEAGHRSGSANSPSSIRHPASGIVQE
jgi:four helix bundle protein